MAGALLTVDQPCRVVEAVCGSRIQGACPGRGLGQNEPQADPPGGKDSEPTIPRADHGSLCVRVPPSSEVMGVVIERIVNALTRVDEADPQCCSLKVALELEPGPLYVLNDLNGLAAFHAAIPPEYEDRIGWNLDVAHWELAGADAGALLKCEIGRAHV